MSPTNSEATSCAWSGVVRSRKLKATRVGAVGQAKDMDPIGMACRHAFEDVGREIAVWIDDGGARVVVQDSKSQLGDERALARSGRPHHSHVARDGREWHLQRSTARLADDHAGRHDESPRRRRCGEGSLARQPGLIEVRIWQIPEAREFEVRERNARRSARPSPARRSHLIAWVAVSSDEVALMADQRIAVP